ncbi:MAG TPA: alpha/beta fold hydrolase [Thermoguttaceae bacterium]|nr:alpha/beta fold hydrolase [Thermoguttaceae bacterium]
MNHRDVPNVTRIVVHGESGPVLLLVHGFPLDGSMWDGQVDAMASRCRVIAPDLRGFGRLGPPPLGEATTMEQMADDLASLLDSLGISEPVVLAGLSMGGYVALAFCRKYPGRLAGLVLCDTRAAADSPETVKARHETARRVLAEGTGPLADGMIPRLFAAGSLDDRPELADAVRRMALRADRRGAAAALLGMARREDHTGLLSHIGCPTLLVVGSEDVITPPEEMRAMRDAIDGARLVEIPDAGHMSPMERPAAFNGAVGAFLAGL